MKKGFRMALIDGLLLEPYMSEVRYNFKDIIKSRANSKMDQSIHNFFKNSDFVDYLVLRQLSHINLSWELTWDRATNEYKREEGTFAGLLNDLIVELSNTPPPEKYHDNEDALAEYVIQNLKWDIKKVGNKWIGADYDSILEQGGFEDIDEKHLVQAAAGRIKGAIDRNQLHFDDMEESHRRILAGVLAIILYHREYLLQ